MRLFKKQYVINLKETQLNLEYLNIERLDQIYNFEVKAFDISSLGYFNQVQAKFERQDSDDTILLTLQLPKKKYLLQLIPIAFFLLIGVGIISSGEYHSNEFSRYLVYSIPLIIIFMGYIYQKEFLKESRQYLDEITTPV